jgi:hypothetical protein
VSPVAVEDAPFDQRRDRPAHRMMVGVVACCQLTDGWQWSGGGERAGVEIPEQLFPDTYPARSGSSMLERLPCERFGRVADPDSASLFGYDLTPLTRLTHSSGHGHACDPRATGECRKRGQTPVRRETGATDCLIQVVPSPGKSSLKALHEHYYTNMCKTAQPSRCAR